MATDDRTPNDDVASYPADSQQMQTYRDAAEALAQFQAPVLVHADHPHERLFVASFDGTGNSKYKDPGNETKVGKMDGQMRGGGFLPVNSLHHSMGCPLQATYSYASPSFCRIDKTMLFA